MTKAELYTKAIIQCALWIGIAHAEATRSTETGSGMPEWMRKQLRESATRYAIAADNWSLHYFGFKSSDLL